jgi:ABC-type Mn2+/Zn2+ transport system ATPase subunit
MKINLTTKYKSLNLPLEIDLPDFTILTGVNGAGKTHFLSGISTSIIQIIENGVVLNPPQNNTVTCKYVSSHSLTPNESAIITREQLNQSIQQVWQQYQQFQNNFKLNPNHKIEHNISDVRQRKIITLIAKDAKKNINELSSDDFYKFYPLDDGMHNNVFYQNFSNLFKRYQDKYDDNQYKQYRVNSKGHDNIEFLTDEQFTAAYGEAPWDFVNKIIKEAKLDYHINSPSNSHRDAPFELKLVNNFNKAEIQFSELSSGEKVLMSLALALYNSKNDFDFPKVLLMDEPDASLHPSMSKQFLDVIERVFVRDKGVKVIVTTHSPSTVALANEDNLFMMNKIGQRIEKTTKDKALKILTLGVPSFSVNYENRRQVFVESPNDVLFYEKIYQKLSSYLTPEISLCFISSGESRTDKNGTKVSNCDQVINITTILRDGGNNFIWGIIDWDGTKDSSDFVKVLGNGKRYAIENYLFDPILLSALLFREKLIRSEDLGLTNNETYFDLKNFGQEQLQVVANFITDKVALTVKPTDTTTTKYKLLNGLELDIPIWYLHHQGHSLEDILLITFPALNALKKGKEESLKLEIINKVIDDIPELISVELLDVLKSVQAV